MTTNFITGGCSIDGCSIDVHGINGCSIDGCLIDECNIDGCTIFGCTIGRLVQDIAMKIKVRKLFCANFLTRERFACSENHSKSRFLPGLKHQLLEELENIQLSHQQAGLFQLYYCHLLHYLI